MAKLHPYVATQLEVLADRTGLIRESMERQAKKLDFKAKTAALHFASAVNAMQTAEAEMKMAAREECEAERRES